MILPVLLLAANGLLAQARTVTESRADVCCADLGCFANTGPFFSLLNRPLSSTPDCGMVSSMKLHLNSRQVPLSDNSQILDPYQLLTITNSDFKKDRETKILIHGFTDHFEWPWWTDMVSALLLDGDFNILRLDWSSGNSLPYMKATANTRLAGAYIAKFINVLKNQLDYNPSKIHIIGHSLGAHIAGYAGERVDKIGRISGIDPAGLYFTNMENIVRLDPSDATIVDTLITDGESILSLGFGSAQSMGHLNFYVNGGFKQPGCSSLLTVGSIFDGPSSFNNSAYDWQASGVQTFYQTVGCNHWRALSIYIESIPRSNCPMKAFHCATYNEYLLGKCFSCITGQCSDVGYHVDLSLKDEHQQKSLYAVTTDRPPFCKRGYKLAINLEQKTAANDARQEKGIIYVTIIGSRRTSAKTALTESAIDLNPGASLTFLMHTESELGNIQSVILYWESKFSILSPSDWLRTHYLHIAGDIVVQDQNQVLTNLRASQNKVEEKKDWAAFANRS